ncbi:GTPase-associated protein 1-related protein [Spirillospora sp. CA-253888]
MQPARAAAVGGDGGGGVARGRGRAVRRDRPRPRRPGRARRLGRDDRRADRRTGRPRPGARRAGPSAGRRRRADLVVRARAAGAARLLERAHQGPGPRRSPGRAAGRVLPRAGAAPAARGDRAAVRRLPGRTARRTTGPRRTARPWQTFPPHWIVCHQRPGRHRGVRRRPRLGPRPLGAGRARRPGRRRSRRPRAVARAARRPGRDTARTAAAAVRAGRPARADRPASGRCRAPAGPAAAGPRPRGRARRPLRRRDAARRAARPGPGRAGARPAPRLRPPRTAARPALAADREAGGWLADADLAGRPLLHAAVRLAVARRDGRVHDQIAAFDLAMDVLAGDREAGEGQVADAVRLVWADRQPTVTEAARLLETHPIPFVVRTGADVLATGDPPPDRAAAHLAELLRHHGAGLLPGDQLRLLDLVAAVARLRAGAPTDPVGEAVTGCLRHLTGGVQAPPKLHAAARDLLVRWLLDPTRIRHRFTEADAELAEFARTAGPELVGAYTERARQRLARELHAHSGLYAACFLLWWRRPGTEAWLDGLDEIYARVLAPAARRLPPAAREEVAATVAENHPKWDAECRQWLDQNAGRRWPRPRMPRLMYRRDTR